jgi:catalase
MEESKIRLRSESFGDHYSHARLFYRSQTEIEQAHIANAFVFELSKVSLEHVRARALSNWRNVDEDLAQRIADGLGIELPAKSKAFAEPKEMEPSPGLRIVGKYPSTLTGRSIAILVTDGADGKIVKALVKQAEAEGATVKIVAPKVGGVILKGGAKLTAHGQLAGMPSVLFDAVALVTAENGCNELLKESAATDFVAHAFGHLKAIGFTRECQPLLDKANVRPDGGVVNVAEATESFIAQARTRLWEREPSVRLLS